MKKSLELLQLELCHSRKIPLTKDQDSRLYNLRRGYEGESKFDGLLRSLGSEHWRILPDYWFDVGKLYQADSIIISTNAAKQIEVLVGEVKNYHRDAEYKQNEFLLGGQPHPENIMLRMSERMTCIKNILGKHNIKCTVKGVMAFVDQVGRIDVDRDFNFNILSSDQIEDFVKWKKVVTDYYNPAMDEVVTVLERYRSKSNFKRVEVADENFLRMRKGIICHECGNFGVNVLHKKVECRGCGCLLNKSEVIKLMAKELQLIFNTPKMVTSGNIYNLSAHTINIKTISTVLSENYTRLGNTWNAHYEVPLV